MTTICPLRQYRHYDIGFLVILALREGGGAPRGRVAILKLAPVPPTHGVFMQVKFTMKTASLFCVELKPKEDGQAEWAG